MAVIQVRVLQERDAAGEPQAAEFLQPIALANRFQTWPDAVMRFIRPLNPSRSERNGAYEYRDPGRGAGELRVEGLGLIDLDRLNELVHMEEICRAIGMRDPNQVEDIPMYLVPFLLRSRNPYVQLFLGVAGLPIFLIMILGPFLRNHVPLYALVILPFIGFVGLVSAILLVRRGFKRLRWWRRARAQAKRDGGPIPEELQAWI